MLSQTSLDDIEQLELFANEIAFWNNLEILDQLDLVENITLVPWHDLFFCATKKKRIIKLKLTI